MTDRIEIRNAVVFTGRDVFDGGHLVVEGGKVAACGPGKAPAAAVAGGRTIDARGALVTPGLTIAHTHLYSALARGIALPGEPAANFVEILDKLWWLLDRELTPGQIELSALLSACDCLRSGVTTIFDHHASFGSVRGSLGVLAEALMKAGLRACLCFEVSDRGGEARARESIEENADFIARCGKGRGGGGLIGAMFGLHASFTIGDETLAACARSADPDTTGFHVHVAEDRADQEETVRRFGKRVVERLAGAGILGRRTICAHAIWLDDAEVGLLARSGSRVAYNPESNMGNAVGALRVRRLEERGVRVVLGTDGFTHNVLREALAGQLLQNHVEGDPRAGWGLLPRIALENNAHLAAEVFGTPAGAIEAGAACDAVLWDYVPPTPLAAGNFWGHAIFGLLDARARTVLVAGRPVLDEGRALGVDEAALAAECRAAAAALWKSMGA